VEDPGKQETFCDCTRITYLSKVTAFIPTRALTISRNIIILISRVFLDK
jgi:hypothetical protein